MVMFGFLHLADLFPFAIVGNYRRYWLGRIYSGRSMLHNSVILRSRYSMRHLWLLSLACQCVFNLFLVGFVQIKPWHTENPTSCVNLYGVGVYLSKGLIKSGIIPADADTVLFELRVIFR